LHHLPPARAHPQARTFNRPNAPANVAPDNGLDQAQRVLVGVDGKSGICGEIRSSTAGEGQHRTMNTGW
jgi:hypothetical protein